MRIALIEGYAAAGRYANLDRATIFRWVKGLTEEERQRYIEEANSNLAGSLRQRFEILQTKVLEKLNRALDKVVSAKDLAIILNILTDKLRMIPKQTADMLSVDRQVQVEQVRRAVVEKALLGDTAAQEIALKDMSPEYRGKEAMVQINIAAIEAMPQHERLKQIEMILDQARKA